MKHSKYNDKLFQGAQGSTFNNAKFLRQNQTDLTIEEAISILNGLKDVKKGKTRKVEKFLGEFK